MKEAVDWFYSEKPWIEGMLWKIDREPSDFTDLEAEEEIEEITRMYMKKIIDNLGYLWD